ncbi:unnamed protein product [Toxocara canis]|uniref:Uncharacterized protein n=1 Tax=Toxocara canis TaxID=6265 RepID=A0A183VET0_TOXCA|nr:unnamed protein product [Toxocara canis]
MSDSVTDTIDIPGLCVGLVQSAAKRMNVADGRSAETTTSPTIPTTEMGNLGMDESAGRLGSMSDSVTDTIDIPGLCVGLGEWISRPASCL